MLVLRLRYLFHCVGPGILLEFDLPYLAEAARPYFLQETKRLSCELPVARDFDRTLHGAAPWRLERRNIVADHTESLSEAGNCLALLFTLLPIVWKFATGRVAAVRGRAFAIKLFLAVLS